jgi:hypothetical protein
LNLKIDHVAGFDDAIGMICDELGLNGNIFVVMAMMGGSLIVRTVGTIRVKPSISLMDPPIKDRSKAREI